MTDEPRRRCTACARRLPLAVQHFAPRATAAKPSQRFAYVCRACKSIENAILYRRKALARAESLAGAIRPLADVERDAIEDAVRLTGGDVPRAARLLGVSKATAYRKLASYARLAPRPEGRGSRALVPDAAKMRADLAEIERRWAEIRASRDVLDEAETRARARDLVRLLRDALDAPTTHAPGVLTRRRR